MAHPLRHDARLLLLPDLAGVFPLRQHTEWLVGPAGLEPATRPL